MSCFLVVSSLSSLVTRAEKSIETSLWAAEIWNTRLHCPRRALQRGKLQKLKKKIYNPFKEYYFLLVGDGVDNAWFLILLSSTVVNQTGRLYRNIFKQSKLCNHYYINAKKHVTFCSDFTVLLEDFGSVRIQ